MTLQAKRTFWSLMCLMAALGVSACSPDNGGEEEAAAEGEAVEEAQAWEKAGEAGDVEFVVIPQDQAADPAIYESAGDGLCLGLGTCNLYFWTDRNMVPQQLPMTEEQARAMVAHYQYKGSTAEETLRLNCSVQQTEDCFQQFTAE